MKNTVGRPRLPAGTPKGASFWIPVGLLTLVGLLITLYRADKSSIKELEYWAGKRLEQSKQLDAGQGKTA